MDQLEQDLQRLKDALKTKRQENRRLIKMAIPKWLESDPDLQAQGKHQLIDKSVDKKLFLVQRQSLNFVQEVAKPWILKECQNYPTWIQATFTLDGFEGISLGVKIEQDKVKVDVTDRTMNECEEKAEESLNELDDLKEWCHSYNDLEAAFTTVPKFMVMRKQRTEMIRKGIQDEVLLLNERVEGHGLTFGLVNESGVKLVDMTWNILARPYREIRNEYTLQFTNSGKKAAKDCGFPNEVFKGQHEYWTALECLENLIKMAKFDEGGKSDSQATKKRRKT